MKKRRPKTAPLTTPFGGLVIGEYDGGAIPDDHVVYTDRDGDWLVFSPQLRAEMRTQCPLCNEHGQHA